MEIELFNKLDQQEREEIHDLFQPASFEAGDEIFTEDGPEEWLYVLTSGSVAVEKRFPPQSRRTLAVMEAPTVVGEMGLLTEPRSAASVVAKTAVEARGIRREEFLNLLESGSLAAFKVMYEIGRTLAARMAETDRSVSEIVARIEAESLPEESDVFQDTLVREWGL